MLLDALFCLDAWWCRSLGSKDARRMDGRDRRNGSFGWAVSTRCAIAASLSDFAAIRIVAVLRAEASCKAIR